jgi:hypothetical protein
MPAKADEHENQDAMLKLAASLALSVVACASAATPPTPRELFTNLSGPAGSVPGLAYRSYPYSPPRGARPTAHDCVALWNANAPTRTRRWIAAQNPRKADVTLLVQGAQVIGGTRKWTAATCAFAFAVAPTAIVYIGAPQKGSADPWSGEVLHYKRAATTQDFSRRFNATISLAGVLHLSL